MTAKTQKSITKKNKVKRLAKKTKTPPKRKFSSLKIHIPLPSTLMMILPSLKTLGSEEPVLAEPPIQSKLDSETKLDLETKPSKQEQVHPYSVEKEQTKSIDTEGIKEVPLSQERYTSSATSPHHLSPAIHPITQRVLTPSEFKNLGSSNKHQPTDKEHQHETTHQQLIPEYKEETIQGKYGQLQVDKHGNYTFTLDPKSPEFILLQKQEPGTDVFELHLTNGTKVIIHIPVMGKQDVPTITGDVSGHVKEDHEVSVSGLLVTNGKIDVQDPDHQESTVQPETINGQFGSLKIDAQGHWQYTVNNAQSAVQALIDKTSLHETFVIHTKDGTPQTLEMSVSGDNDKALVYGIDSSTVKEDQDLQASGKLEITDPDANENHFSEATITGTFGTLNIDKGGHWTYDLDNNHPNIQSLSKGSTATDTVTVHSADGTPHQILITIQGSNDQALITGTSSGAVTEDKQLQTSGSLSITDIDTGEAHFSNTDVSGAYGTLHLTDAGHWTYDLDNNNPNTQSLAKGSTATDTITVHSADSTPHQILITIQGSNDQALITGTSSGAVTEDKQLQTTGSLGITDIDSGEAHFSNTDVSGAYGTLHLTDAGHWTYDLDNNHPNIQSLSKGSTATDTITVHSADGTPHQILITIQGSNDQALITGTSSGTVTEDQQMQTSGSLSINDIDAGEAHFSNTDVPGTYGTLHLTDAGHWTYDLDNNHPNIQSLSKGSTAIDTITVHSADGTPHQVLITIQGSNDQALITGTSSGAVTEDKQLQTTGSLGITDIDSGEAHFSNTDVSGAYGTLHLTDSGQWTYDLDKNNPNTQSLAKGSTATDTIAVHSADGTPHQILITIQGSNDQALITGTSSGAVTEDKQLQISGSLIITDIDTGEAHFSDTSISGAYGTLHLTDAGHWTYDLDNKNAAIQTLGMGETATDTITIFSADGTPHQIQITINGSNDTPFVSSSVSLPSSKEDTVTTITQSQLLAHASDIDVNDQKHLSVTNLIADHGTVLDNKDGTFSFTPEKDYNGDVKFSYEVQDSHGGKTIAHASMSLSATPDNAQITYAASDHHLNGVTEDRNYIDTHDNLHFNGQLNIIDPDSGEAQFDINYGPQTYNGIGYDTKFGGHVLLMRDGHYTYTIRDHQPLVQNLKQGETITDECVIRSKDGTTFTLQVNIHGTNDRPSLTAQHQAVTEDGAKLNGQMLGHDIDHGAQLTYSVANPVAGLTFNPDGSYSFDPSHRSYQHLAQGQTDTLTIPVTVKDEHGARATQNLEIEITGTNDTAKISGTDTGDVHENQAGRDMSPDHAQPGMAILGQNTLTTHGTLTVIDPDSGESVFDKNGGTYSYNGQYGHLQLNRDGSWNYAVSAGTHDWHRGTTTTTVGSIIDQLGAGQTLTDTVTVRTKDGTTHDIVITIHGDNDKPYISGEVTLNSGKEDLAQTITQTQLLAHSIDVDTNDAGNLTVHNLHADHGSVRDNKDGTYTFTPDKDFNGNVHFTYDVHDTHGGITHTGATTSLAAVADAAVITGTDTGSITEDHHILHDSIHGIQVTGSLSVNDPDAGQDHFKATNPLVGHEKVISDPFLGELRIDSHGNWDYRLSNDNSAVQSLKEGETKDVIYEVHSADGTPHRITITVTGTNDAPRVSSAVRLAAGTEDTAVTIQVSDLLANASDVDHNAQLSIHNLAADHGQIAVNPDGSYTFTPDKDYNGPVQFTYEIHDEHGASVAQTASMNLAAVGDAAVITGQDTGHVYESAYIDRSPDYQRGNISHLWNDDIHTSGKLDITDPDAGEAHFDNNAPQYQYFGQYGRLILQPDGNWSYYASVGNDSVGRAIDALNQGETLIDTITIRSADGTSHDVKVSIHGDNDRPFCSSEVQLSAGTEDTGMTLTSTQLLANTMDVDTSDQGKLTIQNLHADHGSLRDNKDGTYTFTPDKDFNGNVHFTYDVHDAHGGVTHTGATTSLAAVADAAVITGTDTGSITEDQHVDPSSAQTIMVSGSLSVLDPDAGQDFFQQNQFGEHAIHDPFGGMLHISRSGNWGYEVDNDRLQYLKEGDIEHVVYRVRSADGTEHQITITVNGTNDAPSVSSSVTLAPGTEDQSVVLNPADLLMHASDIDYDETRQLTVENLQADHGTITKNANGTFSFTPEPDYNGPVHFNYDVTDPHGASVAQTASMNLAAVADAATITGTGRAITEDQGMNRHYGIKAFGSLHVVDPDGPAESRFEDPVTHGFWQGSLGGELQINPDGQYIYTMNNYRIDHLSEGQVVKDHFVVHSIDGTTHTLDFTITGTNDAPSLSTNFFRVTEDAALVHGKVQFKDDDLDTQTFSVSGAPAGFHLDPNTGAYTFDPSNAAYQHLSENEVAYLRFDIKVTDNHGLSDTKTLAINVTGTNDAPTVSSAVVLPAGTEDTDVIITRASLLANASDIDQGETSKLTLENIQADHGMITKNADGTFTFSPDPDYNGPVQFTYDVQDPHGAQVATSASMILAAVDDPSVFSGRDSVDLTEDKGTYHTWTGKDIIQTGQNNLDLIDPDTGKVLLEPTGTAHGTGAAATGSWRPGSLGVGEFILHADGRWFYKADNNNPSIQALGQGESLVETIQVRGQDGSTHTLSATIHGQNDVPTIHAHTYLAQGTEDTDVHFSAGQFGFTDTDSHDSLDHITITSLPDASKGQFLLNGQPVSANQAINSSDIAHLIFKPVTNFNGDVDFKYTVNDGHTDSAEATQSIGITAVNDAPTVSSAVTLASGTEDTTATIQASDLLANARDIDAGETAQLSVHNLQANHGKVVDNHDGTFTFTPEVNYNGPVQFTYDVQDPHGASVAQSASMTLMSVNDAPVLCIDIADTSDNVLNATEAQSATISGNVDPAVAATLNRIEISDGTNTITIDGSGVTLAKDGSFQVTGVDLSTLQDGNLTVTAHATSFDGTAATTSDTITKDSITTINRRLDSASDTGISNTDHITKDNTPTITGGGEPGATVEISVGGVVVGSGVVDGGGHYSITTSPLSDGMNVLHITSTDSAGNTSKTALGVTIDTSATASISVDPITADNVIDASESATTIAVTGSVSGDVHDGATVTLTVNGSDYNGTVTGGRYSIDVLGSDLAADTNVHAAVSGTDAAGNVAIANTDHSYSIDTTASASDDSNTAKEDSTAPVTGNVLSNDADATNVTSTGNIQGTYGMFHLNADGSYTYTLDNSLPAIQHLGTTSTPLVDSVSYTVTDGQGNQASANLAISIHGTNDAPTIKSSVVSTKEDTDYQFKASDIHFSDIDGDKLDHITVTQIDHGTLSLRGHAISAGDTVSAQDIEHLIFTPTSNYHGIGAVRYTGNDGQIDSKVGLTFISIQDVADPATFTGDSTGRTQEDITLQASGTLIANDPDGTTGFIAVQGGVGIVGSKGYGHAHIDSNGHWTYNLYNNHAIVQQLKQGQTETEIITVQAKDGTTHDITIRITGTNDAPSVSEHLPLGKARIRHSVDEDSNPDASGQIDIHDADGDITRVNVDPNHNAQYGNVLFDRHTNTWTYHLNNANPHVDALNDGDTLTDRFTLLVDDGHGGTVSKEIIMTINGHTDPVPYTPPTISVTVDTRNAHHITAGISASTIQTYAHSIGQHATTTNGHHEISGSGHSDIIIVQGRLNEEAELESGNDILYIGGRLTDEEIEGGHGSDTLILGAYTRHNAPRLKDHGEKISDGHEEMELESIENIILGDGTVLKGHLPANFPSVGHDHYEVPVNIQAQLSSGDESVSGIRLTHLQHGLTLQSNGHDISANPDGSYTVPANGHLVVVSTHPLNRGQHYFETEVTTHNSVTGVTAVTTEDLQGHIQSHVNPPPPPPPVQHDEPDVSPLDNVQDFTVTFDDALSDGSPSTDHAQAGNVQTGHEHNTGAAAYLDALGITPSQTDSDSSQPAPADLDIVLAQVDDTDNTTMNPDGTDLDLSDALAHQDLQQDHDDTHHPDDLAGLPDMDPNN